MYIDYIGVFLYFSTYFNISGRTRNMKKARKFGLFREATTGFEPVDQGFADPRLTTWLCRHIFFYARSASLMTPTRFELVLPP